MRSWVQGNGRAVTRSFDYDGRLTSHSFDSGTRTLAYDAKSRIAQVTEPWGNRLFGYDAADRVTAEQTWSGTWSYGWDGNGNRLSQTTPFGSTSYSLAPGTNQLTSASGQERVIGDGDQLRADAFSLAGGEKGGAPVEAGARGAATPGQ